MGNHGQRNGNNPEKKLRTVHRSPTSFGRGIFRIPRGKGGIILLVVVIVASYCQGRISDFFTKKSASPNVVAAPVTLKEHIVSPDNDATEFTTTLIATLDETWQTLFQTKGLPYQPPHIVIYREPVHTPCHNDKLAIGTFYCPQDNSVYVSLTLYDGMKKTLGAGGDFTLGYVIAHAFGHHIQQQLKLETGASTSPEHELQADCFAGLWGHRMAEQQILSSGDLQQALNVARIIDEEQRLRPQGTILPETFSYAHLDKRYQWFNRGFVSGELQQCLHFDDIAMNP